MINEFRLFIKIKLLSYNIFIMLKIINSNKVIKFSIKHEVKNHRTQRILNGALWCCFYMCNN